MNNSTLKFIMACFTAFGFVFSMAASSFASMSSSETGYCVRVYCAKDKKTKLRNPKGHGDFLASVYDSKTKSYHVNAFIFNELTKKCNSQTLFGSSAHLYEGAASLYPIKVITGQDASKAAAINEECQKMEK